jgi:hypothetical protein
MNKLYRKVIKNVLMKDLKSNNSSSKVNIMINFMLD